MLRILTVVVAIVLYAGAAVFVLRRLKLDVGVATISIFMVAGAIAAALSILAYAFTIGSLTSAAETATMFVLSGLASIAVSIFSVRCFLAIVNRSARDNDSEE